MTPGVIDRLHHLIRRRRNAKRLDIPFRRASTFEIPDHVRLDGRAIRLAVPREPYQKVAFVELLLDDCYDLRAIGRESTVRTVLDIGANIGLFGVAARAAFPNATIHAYEPNAAVEADLAWQAREWRLTYFLEAVGSTAGTVSLDVDPRQSVLSRTQNGGSIPQIAFATALERLGGSADLVKMDCEGAEWDILRDTISWRQVENLSMEYHLDRAQSHDAIVDALRNISFEVLWQKCLDGFGLVRARRRRA